MIQYYNFDAQSKYARQFEKLRNKGYTADSIHRYMNAAEEVTNKHRKRGGTVAGVASSLITPLAKAGSLGVAAAGVVANPWISIPALLGAGIAGGIAGNQAGKLTAAFERHKLRKQILEKEQ